MFIITAVASTLIIGCSNPVPPKQICIDTLTVYIEPNETIVSVSEIGDRGYVPGYTITIFNGDMYYTKFVSRWNLPRTMNGNQLLIKYKEGFK